MQKLFNPFEGMSIDTLESKKKIYEQLIAEHDKNYVQIISKKTGKPINTCRTPWMVPIWQKGLNMINETIIKNTSIFKR